MTLRCSKTGQQFTIDVRDLELLEKLSPRIGGRTFPLPVPDTSPQYRFIEKLCRSNYFRLYERLDSLHGQKIVSLYNPEKKFPVWQAKDWWSDDWDPLSYGRPYDFAHTFFEQFSALASAVPTAALTVIQSENCDYCSGVFQSKDCYLCAGNKIEHCLYGTLGVGNYKCVDWLVLVNCKYCYECVACRDCYQLFYSQFSTHCSDAWFLRDCDSCQDCFGCVGLRQKRYYVFNQKHSKTEYLEFVARAKLHSRAALLTWAEKCRQFFQSCPHLSAHLSNCEDSSGEDVRAMKNSQHCFITDGLDAVVQDTRYAMLSTAMSDCFDVVDGGGGAELCYNCNGFSGQRNVCCHGALGSELLYCIDCTDCSNLLGCVGLRRKQYCILNLQYTREEYEQRAVAILEHMQKTEEFGKFFPGKDAPFGYNESFAHCVQPLQKEEALRQGFAWSDYVAPVARKAASITPEALDDMRALTQRDGLVLECAQSARPFRLTSAECRFYQEFNLPPPTLHPELRLQKRLQAYPSFSLHQRTCGKCAKSIESSYPAASAALVYCPECFAEWRS